MLIISHRGCLDGARNANHPEDISQCLAEGFCVEVDLHWDGRNAFFGHDGPTYPVILEEWDRKEIFFHMKTANLPDLKHADAFAIESDPYAITLRGYVWTNYGVPVFERSIVCAPELVNANEPLELFVRRNKNAAGICTDYPREVRRILSNVRCCSSSVNHP